MRIVGASGPATGFTSGARGGAVQDDPQAPEGGSHALVQVTPVAESESSPSPTRHPAAPFLAQLIATHLHAPQTRARRREAPELAVAVYRSMTKPVAQRRPLSKRA